MVNFSWIFVGEGIVIVWCSIVIGVDNDFVIG